MNDSQHTSSPKSITITDDGALRYYWNAWLPALYWGTIGAFLVWMGFFGLDAPGIGCFSLFLFFPGGIALLYVALGKALNYTEFRNEDGNLLIQHKPLPWRGNKSIPLAKIDEVDIGLDIEDITTQHWSGRVAIGYIIFVQDSTKTKKGRIVLLRSGHNLSLESANILTWQLENVLGKPHYPDRAKRIARLKKRLTQYNSKSKR